MTRKQWRLTMIGGSLAVLALALGLVLNAMRDSIVFFSTPATVAEKHIGAGKRFRLGGLVQPVALNDPLGADPDVLREQPLQRPLVRAVAIHEIVDRQDASIARHGVDDLGEADGLLVGQRQAPAEKVFDDGDA